jgi:hypothetical protein
MGDQQLLDLFCTPPRDQRERAKIRGRARQIAILHGKTYPDRRLTSSSYIEHLEPSSFHAIAVPESMTAEE